MTKEFRYRAYMDSHRPAKAQIAKYRVGYRPEEETYPTEMEAMKALSEILYERLNKAKGLS